MPLGRERGDHGPRDALHAAEHECQEHREGRELGRGFHHRGEDDRRQPAGEAHSQRAHATPACGEPAHEERAGQRYELHEQHEPNEGRRVEVQFFEGEARELRNRRLHPAEHECGAEEHAAERSCPVASQ